MQPFWILFVNVIQLWLQQYFCNHNPTISATKLQPVRKRLQLRLSYGWQKLY